MLISGFTIVRNAVKYDFPVIESIKSILPICGEFVVSLGDSEDGTEELIKSIDDTKIKIYYSPWDLSNRNTRRGEILKEKTDLALDLCQGKWAFYLQADEVVNEEDLPKIKDLVEKNTDKKIDAFSFDYYHFYGSYDRYITDPSVIYPWAIRIIRNNKQFEAKGDACTFILKKNWLGLRRGAGDVRTGCHIYHYGMVRPVDVQKERLVNMYQFYKDVDWAQGNLKYYSSGQKFEYEDLNKEKFAVFKGLHPDVMKDRIKRYNESSI